MSGLIDAAALDELLSPAGQTLLRELEDNPAANEADAGLITRLRKRFVPALVAAAIEEVRLRVKARTKFSNASRMYFTREGLEQASSERMARHHAIRFEGFTRIADLCTGIGGDLIGLADGREVVAVDKDPVHVRMAKLNADANDVGDAVSIICEDVRGANLDRIGAVFVDPARRTSDKRLTRGASEPPLAWCVELSERGLGVGVKAAPGLPADLIPGGWEAEFVSEHRELKECALWSPKLATAQRRATILPDRHTLTQRAGISLDVREPGRFLVDPDPAVTRSGLVKELGQSIGECWQIDEQVAFLSVSEAVSTPFGRTLEVAASEPWSLARLKQQLRALDVGTVDIRKRGSAVDVDDVQRRLKLSGSRAATVVLTRYRDRPWMLVCFPPDLRTYGFDAQRPRRCD